MGWLYSRAPCLPWRLASCGGGVCTASDGGAGLRGRGARGIGSCLGRDPLARPYHRGRLLVTRAVERGVEKMNRRADMWGPRGNGSRRAEGTRACWASSWATRACWEDGKGGWQAGWAGWLARAEQAEPARPSSLFLFLFSFSSSLIRIQIWFLNLDSKLVHHIHWSC